MPPTTVKAARGDLAGQLPIYFNPDALERGFSSQPNILVSSPQIDTLTLAAAIMWPGSNPLSSNYTYYKNLRKLQPGDIAAITQDKLSIQSPYQFEDSNLTFIDTAVKVGATLRQRIVKLTTQKAGLISSDFSGGLDSTTVALTAAAYCLDEDTILGLVQYNKEYPAGDILYARRFANLSNKLILRELVTTHDDLPFVSLPPPDISPHEPYRGLAIFGREHKRLLSARAYHLTGDAGDALFDPEPVAILTDLLERGEHDLIRNIALHIGRGALVSPEAILENVRLRARATLSTSYERVARQLTSDHLLSRSEDWLPSLGIASTWLTPRIREALAARARELAMSTAEIRFTTYATRQAISDSGDAHRHLRMLAARCGVDLIAPYLDETILQTILTLPATLRIQPGQFKPLLRAASALSSLAPTEIFTRQGKGAYSAEYQAGFTAALPRIREQLQNLRLAHLDIIDPEMVQASLSNKTLPLASLSQLLASENWLAQLGIEAPSRPTSLTYSGVRTQTTKEVIELPTQTYIIPESLHISAASNGKLIAFDNIKGSFHILQMNHTARLIFQSLAVTRSPELTLNILHAEYPTAPTEQLRGDLVAAIHNFVRQGWLQPTDIAETQIVQLSTLKLPNTMREQIISYIKSLEKNEPTDAHHFASAVIGKPTTIIEANNSATDVVRRGRAISTEELSVGMYGVIGVLKSAHGLTHGLHSVIGLGGGNCLSVIARQGNIGVAPIKNFLNYYKRWLVSIDLPGDAEKVKLYTDELNKQSSPLSEIN